MAPLSCGAIAHLSPPQAFPQHMKGGAHDDGVDGGTGGGRHREHAVAAASGRIDHDQCVLQGQNGDQGVDEVDRP